jgi:uncharacterized iron-regulated membrane protein
MRGSRFTEAERSTQRIFRKQGVYCEQFATSYGRFMTPSMIRLRRAWFQVHKWIGIVLAILIIALSLSGAALVWHDWLDGQVNPQRYPKATSTLLAPAAYVRSANRLLKSGERIASVSFPDGDGSVQVTVSKPSLGGGRPQRSWIWLNPATADPIDRAGTSEGLVRILHSLHGSLLIPGAGRQIVGWIGVAMLLSSLTGIWLWWPLKGKVTRGLRWNRRPDVNSNLHHMGGFWIAIPLAVLSLTGVWISFPAVFSQLSAGPNAARPGGPGATPLPLMLPRQSVDTAAASAQALAPGRVTNIVWPTDRKAEWTVTLEGDGSPTEIKVEDLDGSAKASPVKPETLARTMRRIHDGTGMPLAWQIVIFVGGILPAVLAVTGILMWLRMRRRREKHRRGAAAFAEAEALAS